MHNPIDQLIHQLSKLPTIGEKTAMRLALHILRQPPEYGQGLAQALNETVGQVRFCESCCNLTLKPLCPVCENTHRNPHLICVVEDIADLQAIERSMSFKGHYHVLHGALSPIDGIGPDELRIAELKSRLQKNPNITEMILATNPNVNGDATALYLLQTLKPLNVKMSRLAMGLPVGAHIEFADGHTLARAIEGRVGYE